MIRFRESWLYTFAWVIHYDTSFLEDPNVLGERFSVESFDPFFSDAWRRRRRRRRSGLHDAPADANNVAVTTPFEEGDTDFPDGFEEPESARVEMVALLGSEKSTEKKNQTAGRWCEIK